MMANKIGLSNEVKEMKLGKSFCKGGNPSFHTFRYDFMPASVDVRKRATVDIGDGHQVTVTAPHIEGSGTSNTVFKGSKKPYQKECVLIIDHSTGEITLEKLSYNVQLKKTRAEGSSKIRSNTPVDSTFNTKKSPPTQKFSPQPQKSATYSGVSPPLAPLPRSTQPSPKNVLSPSMPCFNMPSVINEPPVVHIANDVTIDAPEIGVLSSSSSDSSSGESSDSDNEEKHDVVKSLPNHGMPILAESPSAKDTPSSSRSFSSLSMPTTSSLPSMPKFSQLSEDLKLSDSDESDF